MLVGLPRAGFIPHPPKLRVKSGGPLRIDPKCASPAPLLAALALGWTLPGTAGISFVTPNPGDPMEVRIDDQVFTAFRTDTRVPCLYPLIGPSGANLTRHYPLRKDVPGEASDHPHHTSFWFTHGAVNGHDFWHDPDCSIVAKSTVTGSDSLTAHLEWIAKGQVILREKRQYTFASRDQTRTITVTSQLTPATGDVVFGDTKEGSFAIRLAPTLRHKGEVAKGHILNSEGLTDGKVWGQRAKWVACYGPDANEQPAVVAILDHPTNLRHPTWWHARDYGLLGANPFGRHDFEGKKDQPHLGDHTLKKGDTLTLRYQLLIHQGTVESAKVPDAWTTFAKQ